MSLILLIVVLQLKKQTLSNLFLHMLGTSPHARTNNCVLHNKTDAHLQ